MKSSKGEASREREREREERESAEAGDEVSARDLGLGFWSLLSELISLLEISNPVWFGSAFKVDLVL